MAPRSESAAMALRESFGDRKIPEISRKITACVSCRKLKIKCQMNKDRPPCTRCKTRGNPCTVNKSLQTLLEGDASWKEQMEDRMAKLEASILSTAVDSSSQPSYQTHVQDIAREAPKDDTADPSQIVTLNLSCSLGAFPASSMINFTLSDPRGTSRQCTDLLSRQLIPQQAAESLFSFYKQDMDSFAYNVLTDTDSLASISQRSPLLTVSICTVAAFCSSSPHYRALLDHLKSEVSGKVFSNNHEFDDVRALCIGALWLNEISTALNSLAVRITTELNLHRCITKMPHKKRACYDRTRLYFLVYLCDHHCSLSHGKPPLTRDFHSLKSPRDFLRTEFSLPSDLKLISQVELWSISNRVFDMFGADVDNCVTSQRIKEIPALSQAYERWYRDWLGILTFVEGPGKEPFTRRVFDFYFYSAKLYLFSHIFRGQATDDSMEGNSSLSNKADTNNGAGDFAEAALKSALSIVCLITKEGGDLQNLPYYIGTVTAFACVCLVKASSQSELITCDVDRGDVSTHLRELVRVLQAAAFASGNQFGHGHPLQGIAESLRSILTGETESHENGPLYGVFGFDFAMEGLDGMLSGDFEQTSSIPLFRTE